MDNAMPVWKCSEPSCKTKWASFEMNAECPICHIGTGLNQGKLLKDVDDVSDIIISVPLPPLVQLSSLPEKYWIGLPVFHPFSQNGDVASWTMYDVGVVIDVYPDPDFPELLCCRFVVSHGDCTLRYIPDNLWVPKALAENLLLIP